MATPKDLGLIKRGIDQVIKIQTKKGRYTYRTIVKQVEHREGYYKAKEITGFGDADVYSRGAPVSSDRKYQGYETDWYPLRYAKAWDKDIYDSDEDVYNELPTAAADIAIAFRRKKNKEAANLFNNGHDGTLYPIYDGQALFSTAHPGVLGNTGTNRPVTGSALSSIAMETAISGLMSQVDPRGESLELEGNIECHLSNYLYPLGWRITEASGFAGTNDNDPNFAGRYVKVIRQDKLTSQTAHYYKMADESEHGLTCIQFSPIRTTVGVEARSEQIVTVTSERYRMAVLSWRGLWGDPGA